MSGSYSDTLRDIEGLEGVKNFLENPGNHYFSVARHVEWSHEGILELLRRIEALEARVKALDGKANPPVLECNIPKRRAVVAPASEGADGAR